jgi:hypothetical protein
VRRYGKLNPSIYIWKTQSKVEKLINFLLKT